MGKCKLMFDPKDPRCVSVTEQAHANECDINMIIARAEKSGMFPVASDRGQFGDFSGIDFQSMQCKIAAAKQAFMALPVAVRTRFSNDVGELLSFLDDVRNRDEAIKLGLIAKPVDNAVGVEPTVPPPAAVIPPV